MLHASTSPFYPIIVSNDITAAMMDGPAGVALTTDAHRQAADQLTGPQVLSPRDELGLLAEVLGRPLRLVEQPIDAKVGAHLFVRSLAPWESLPDDGAARFETTSS